ncbi:Aminodeoxyfutalosine synthase [Candidatus Magnetomoraceae bacterium gMMP-15]
MNTSFIDKNLYKIQEKLKSDIRLNFEDGLLLYNTQDIIGLGHLADNLRCKKHGRKAYYIYNQHINYTNICSNRCLFCAYARDKDENGAFTYSIEDVKNKLIERIDEPVNELHVVGGLNHALSFEYYIEMLKTIKMIRPNAAIKAFTAVEIDHLSKISGYSLKKTINRLKQAGLEMIPGGGAEVMSKRIRQKLFPKKIDSRRWLEIMEILHGMGLTSNATMLYGHIETMEERVRHLIKLRELQDKTQGFSAYIPLAFHSENTKLSHIPQTTAFDDLKNIAVARLMLDNFEHIKAYWIMIGERLAQLALSFGADDLDGTIIEEKITHMAGAKSAKGLSRSEMKNLISSAGFIPVERDSFYKPVIRD